jgi:hypothetical protein
LEQKDVETKGNGWLNKRLFILLMAVPILLGLLLVLYGIITGRPGGIYIKRLEIEDTFRQTDKGIYCTITIGNGIIGLPTSATLVAKWYFGSEQVTAHFFETRSNEPITIWLEPPSGQGFQPGEYKLQIYTQQKLIETVEFEVE